MPAHDRIDFRRELAREVDDLATAIGGALASAECSGMRDHHDETGAPLSQGGPNAVADRRGIIEPQTDDVCGAGGRRGRDGRDADDSDSGAAACDDRVVANPRY